MLSHELHVHIMFTVSRKHYPCHECAVVDLLSAVVVFRCRCTRLWVMYSLLLGPNTGAASRATDLALRTGTGAAAGATAVGSAVDVVGAAVAVTVVGAWCRPKPDLMKDDVENVGYILGSWGLLVGILNRTEMFVEQIMGKCLLDTPVWFSRVFTHETRVLYLGKYLASGRYTLRNRAEKKSV